MRRIALFAILFCLAFPLQPAFAAKRVALVIGNSAYRSVDALPNPANDASDMAAKLERLGFAVTSGIDLDLAGVKETLRAFRNAAADAELALFFYAGHGIQANGVNYMLPVDAVLEDEAGLELETLSMDTVLRTIGDVPTLVVFLDACRNNPFEKKLARSIRGRSRDVKLGKGLAQIDAGSGTLIAFSTQPGNVALDGEGRNSPFTSALLKHLGSPGASLTDELIEVRKEVLAATGREQQPWDSSSLTGRVVLNPVAALAEETGGELRAFLASYYRALEADPESLPAFYADEVTVAGKPTRRDIMLMVNRAIVMKYATRTYIVDEGSIEISPAGDGGYLLRYRNAALLADRSGKVDRARWAVVARVAKQGEVWRFVALDMEKVE